MDHSTIPILDRGYTPQALSSSTNRRYEAPQRNNPEQSLAKSSRPPPPPPPSLEPSRSPSPNHVEDTSHPSFGTESTSSVSQIGSIALCERLSPTTSISRPSNHGHSASDATDSSISTLISDPRTPLIDPYYSSVESNGWAHSPKSINSLSSGVTSGNGKPVKPVSTATYFSPMLKTSKESGLWRLEQASIRRVPPPIQTASRPNYPRRKDSLPSASEGDRFSGSTIAPSPVYLLFPKQEPMILEQEPKSAFDDYDDDEPTTRYRSLSSSIRLPLRSSTQERPKHQSKRRRNVLRNLFCCGCSSGE